MRKPKLLPAYNILIFLFIIFICNATLPESSMISMFETNRSRMYIPDIDNGFGVAFTDINGDNRPDLYIVRMSQPNQLLLNINLEDTLFLKMSH